MNNVVPRQVGSPTKIARVFVIIIIIVVIMVNFFNFRKLLVNYRVPEGGEYHLDAVSGSDNSATDGTTKDLTLGGGEVDSEGHDHWRGSSRVKGVFIVVNVGAIK